MDLKRRLELYRLKKEFENYPGVKSSRLLLEGSTDLENKILREIYIIGSSPNDKIHVYENDYETKYSWAREHLMKILNYKDDVIIGEMAVFLDDIDDFLEKEFEKGFNTGMINRRVKKIIVIFTNEHWIKFFERDI